MTEFSLPGSSFEELKKIIMAYASAKVDASLEDIGNLAGLHKTVVSRNNKFLTEIGLVQGGQKKSATELGKRLGRTLEHAQSDDERKAWHEAVQSNEPLSSVMTTVRIKGGMSEEDLTKHVLYVSGQSNNAGNKTGARCVQDVLVASALLTETDGRFAVSSPKMQAANTIQPSTDFDQSPTDATVDEAAMTEARGDVSSTAVVSGGGGPQVSINIQLQIPETKDAEIYDNLFKSLKKHLFPSS